MISYRRLCLPLFFSSLLVCALSLPAINGISQDQSQDQPPVKSQDQPLDKIPDPPLDKDQPLDRSQDQDQSQDKSRDQLQKKSQNKQPEEKAQDQPEDKSNDQAQGKSAKHNDQRDKANAKQARAQEAAKLPPVLWRDPGDIASLDLVNGAGGLQHAPRPDAKYTFVREDMNGTSPKFYVKDNGGVEWLVKMGEEARPETAATRFVWAMGYFTDEDYFVPKIRVSPPPKLHRGSKDVAADGTVSNVRLKRQGKDYKTAKNWDWDNNPFVGTREFNGLRVMMALLNNWDLKNVNNKIYVVDNEAHYVVSDLGATFGKTGAVSSRSKGSLKDYEESKFVRERKDGKISFEMRTRPLPLLAPFEMKNYAKRSHMQQIEDDIPVADAAWIGSQLGKLSPRQMQDAFRTAGYSPNDAEAYTRVVQNRIGDLK